MKYTDVQKHVYIFTLKSFMIHTRKVLLSADPV